jgi:hypothetical protein
MLPAERLSRASTSIRHPPKMGSKIGGSLAESSRTHSLRPLWNVRGSYFCTGPSIKSPLFTAFRKDLHSWRVNDRKEPSGFREFRIRIESPTAAISTQLPLWPDAVLLRHVMAVCSEWGTHPPLGGCWFLAARLSQGSTPTRSSPSPHTMYAMPARTVMVQNNVADIRARREGQHHPIVDQ